MHRQMFNQAVIESEIKLEYQTYMWEFWGIVYRREKTFIQRYVRDLKYEI